MITAIPISPGYCDAMLSRESWRMAVSEGEVAVLLQEMVAETAIMAKVIKNLDFMTSE